MSTKFVLGFMFDPDFNRVALIQKNRPSFMKGKLNGIGGRIEENESEKEAMIREFKEETGVDTIGFDWKWFALMKGINDDGTKFYCSCFATIGNLNNLKSITDENINIVSVDSEYLRIHGINNLPWMVYLAIDHLKDGRPNMAYILYP